LRPPILRRISVGNDAAIPTAIRPDVRRITIGISEIYPPDYPAKQTGNIRATARTLPVNVRSNARKKSGRIRFEAVRVNQGRDCVSPVVASMYCSPHPAALHIDPPPGSGCFAFRIPRPENCLTKMVHRRGRGIMAENIYAPPPF